MKKFAILSFLALISIGCNSAAQQRANANTPAQKSDSSQAVSSHSQTRTDSADGAGQTPTVVQKSETKTKWTQSGNPINTNEFDAEIVKAQKDLKTKPKDEASKNAAAESYLKRALALTDARQYASALGDFRRVLKYDASNEEAKKWIQQIIEIYDGMNKQSPVEGEEPPPLPFQKES